MTIAEKYAAQWMPNGEVSLADLIQAAMDEAQSVAVVAQNPSRMCVVFDGPPSGEAPRFIEVEDGNGNSINAGEWLKRDDGLWELRLIAHLPLRPSTATAIPAAELDALRKDAGRLNSGCILTNSWNNPGEKVLHTGCNLRADIDAAIAQEKGE